MPTAPLEYLIPCAIALGLGLLVGMQREWKASSIAGIRTFPLITLLGAVLAILAEPFGGWVVAAGLVGVAAMLFIGNIARMGQGEPNPGLTTEMAALVMFSVGAALVAGLTELAVIIGGVVAVLLHWKEPLHTFVRRIGERDIRAVIQLVLIALVILPALPNQAYDPYEVLNPFKIWLMVVLIVGISLVAYVIYRMLGARTGAIVGGILGGFISSTATTVSYARNTREHAALAPLAALVILIASTIVNVRILIEIGIVAPQLLPVAAPPMGVMLGLMTILCLLMVLRVGRREAENLTYGSPTQLRAALIFGALYAIVIFAVAAAKEHFGTRGIYILAGISGLTDVDAITLSTAELFNAGQVTAETAWRVILLASMSNLVFKAAAAGILGNLRLLVWVAILFGISLAGGGLLLAFWPAP